MCQFLNNAVEESFKDGSWADAFQKTLGKSGVDTPTQPALDTCQ